MSFGSPFNVRFLSLPHLLEHQAKNIPDAPAILAPGRAPLTYGRLYQHVHQMCGALQAMGIGRQDRIVVVLPNGPEMALTVLTVATCAVCAPLNHAYESAEFDRYFADLRPRALITQAGIDSPARQAALAHGVRIIELSTQSDAEAGIFTLTGDQANTAPKTSASPDDVALLLLTSGTTARPRIVPQTHANICASAYCSVAAFGLTQADRCLNVLPLFHGHGLHNTLIASLAAGASVVCTAGCHVNRFFGWLTEFRPTWYSAVPTMHQAILAYTLYAGEQPARFRLRFVRSASAPLPLRILAELEQTFEAPVIEAYGMTEVTSSPIACNPLPPRQRKPGSVGLPVGLDVAIMDEDGAMLSVGQAGQVVVRGASVTVGYDGDQTTTEAAFTGDWFKTGDLGFFDSDGYLFLVGRLREVINRGGEKIAPLEVDAVLQEHPAVAEVVTFAVPHATLGEDIAAAVVLCPECEASPEDIRQFAFGRIADFKVPRQVFVVSEVPKGPTGKKHRIGLAARLGLANNRMPERDFVAPRTPLEEVLAKRWSEILGIEPIGIHDDFFVLGGDSLLAIDALAQIHQISPTTFEVSRFFQSPTVAAVACHIERLLNARHAAQSPSTIVRTSRENAIMVASPAQERLWRLQQALYDIPFFNVLHALRITLPCDLALLEQCINEMVRRHEILRTTFGVIDGRHVQVIAPQLIVSLTSDDLRALQSSDRDACGNQIIQDEVLHSFDLEKGPLIRTRLIRLTEQDSILLISMHQSICDGWSLRIFVDELVTLYEAFSISAASPLPPLPFQYADFAHWQRDWRSHSEIVAQLSYWRERLREPLPVLSLAKCKPAPAIDDLLTERRRWTFPAGLMDDAKRLSRQEGSTLFMVLVAGLLTLLHRYLGQDDICVATNVANRNRPGTSGLIGPLANMVILRTNLGGDPSLREVLRRTRATTLEAFDHQDLTFEELAEALKLEDGVEPASIVRIMILLQSATLRSPVPHHGALACEVADPDAILPLLTTTTFDIILAVTEGDTRFGDTKFSGTCIYKPHLFDLKEIDCLIRDFECTIAQLATQPEKSVSEIRVLGMRNDRPGTYSRSFTTIKH